MSIFLSNRTHKLVKSIRVASCPVLNVFRSVGIRKNSALIALSCATKRPPNRNNLKIQTMKTTEKTLFKDLSKEQVLDLANNYSYAPSAFITDKILPELKHRGYLVQEEFQEICEWKTQRSKSRVAQNESVLIEEASKIVFSTR